MARDFGEGGTAAWLRELTAAVDADNLTAGTTCGDSRTARLLTSAPPMVATHAALALADLQAEPARLLRLLRSDILCREFAVCTDGVAVNLAVARMTVPGGPWPGNFGLEAVAFTAQPAEPPEWFPPPPDAASVVAHRLCFGTPIVASRAFTDGSGSVLFPEQLSVSSRSPGQAFGVVFLSKLATLFTAQVLPVLDAAVLGFEPSSTRERDAVREVAFAAHEWGHHVGGRIEQGVATRRRRLAAVLSELHADLAALTMLLGDVTDGLADPAARVLVLDRVVREAWLPRPEAQVDAIAARHLLRLLADGSALTFGAAGLRVDLAAVQEATASHLDRVAAVLTECGSGDLGPAVDYLTASGWRMDGAACRLDLGANLGAAMARHTPRTSKVGSVSSVVRTVERSDPTSTPAGFDLGEADRLLTTTRSVRRRLDRRRPVPLSLVLDALAVAIQAPTSGNLQDWRWLVVTEPAIRADVGAIYRRACATITPPASGPADREKESSTALAEHLGEVPVLVVAGYRRRPWHSRSTHRALVDATVHGSVYPAVWSLQLALRARGLASCFVAAHLRYADEVARAISLPDHIAQAGLVAVAWPDHDHFRPARRRPLTEVVRVDRRNDADEASSVGVDDGTAPREAGRL